ncbi:major facilitator superfamily domain-containing protein [Radiomyces spectabilis]|uniref:major facilitator superfamily domain-containing protein n=1 Tax=Radiomyces spectabilis TaxID=64574 RepID=UPI002220A821|nr:major facilitator superfamily domain-containing protein [Radiomyces spectabilis]KAI8384298.1 major facilitator superfamily domain-containing protein [Radiomyces spectabilis]
MGKSSAADVEVEQIEKRQDSAVKRHLKAFRDSIYHKPEKPTNMWHLLTNLTNTQRITFAAAFFGWTLDAFDFFSVSLTTAQIAKDFNVEPSEVTSAITTTLMLRPIGALIFGALADKYGRRWPLMADIVLYSLINMASGFAPNLQTFIGLRAVFGIAMGGEWGLGASLALESLPIEARGLFSGIFQEGYACGYLLATLVNYAIEETGSSWRILFWVGASFALLAIVIRFWVPESEAFEKQQEARRVIGRSLLKETWIVLKHHWLRLIYMVILMAFMNFFSHGSQDLYPTFLTSQLGYTPTQKTVTSVIYNIGAICGGTIIGYYSSYFGRKLCVAVCAILAGCFIPLWIYGPNIHALQFGAFTMQFFVQGAWGVIPAHINELSPPAFRGLLPGLAYQLGNLISAASSQIEATIGERYPIRNADGSYKLNAEGKQIADYGLTQAIFMGCVCGGLLITILVGKEERNKDFMEHLVEDARSGQAVTPDDVNASRIEQGMSSDGNGKSESDEKIHRFESMQEKMTLEHAESVQPAETKQHEQHDSTGKNAE